ncbi:isochorismatase family protein [Shimazuella sp. AN120528]|uniref:isochorismatase family protein n=1 Tax=Shimazuella soli TaxID=1892854 RepID=UPI001F0FA66C|nr:isochorismatase family protein [Shimazuella soli]MCH5584346.1 isochorismatase family protein [Shimazuella soli]
MDYKKSALVLIDLQKGIVPIASNGDEIVRNAKRLVDRFHEREGLVFFVRVAFHDGQDALKPELDQKMPAAKRSEDWAELVPQLEISAHDFIITKRQWGAFFGTELDLQLRRRGIDTIVLGGISTNIGVETTTREAFQLGYNQIFITDAMAAASKEEHEATCKYIFPKIGKLRVTKQFLSEF